MDMPLSTGVLGWKVCIWSSWSVIFQLERERLQNEMNTKGEAEFREEKEPEWCYLRFDSP